MNNKKKKIILSGGGTGGSVVPLLAIYDLLGEKDYEYYFIGTKNGIEKKMASEKGLRYRYIQSGKLRRYFSLKNFIDPLFVFFGFLESLYFLTFRRQDLIITAGSFVSVPLVWAAHVLRIPVMVHQQDIRPGLANKIMSRSANVVTTVFEKSMKGFKNNVIWTGNPIRPSLASEEKDYAYFDFDKERPVVFILGGGTGSVSINKTVYESLDELTKDFQVIHVSGKGKGRDISVPGYKQFSLLGEQEMTKAYALADIVISRCGLGVLSEVSFLGKPSILIPMPNSHQEDNAQIFKEKQAAIIFEEKSLSKNKLVSEIRFLYGDKEKMGAYARRIKEVMNNQSNEKIINVIEVLLKK